MLLLLWHPEDKMTWCRVFPLLEEGVVFSFSSFFLSFFLHSKPLVWSRLCHIWMHARAIHRETETERVSARSPVTSWPLHVKQHVVQCQWLKQRYARLLVCLSVPHNFSEKTKRAGFLPALVLHEEAVGGWVTCCNNAVVLLDCVKRDGGQVLGSSAERRKKPHAFKKKKNLYHPPSLFRKLVLSFTFGGVKPPRAELPVWAFPVCA